MRRASAAALLLALLIPAAAAAQEVLEESWSVMSIQGLRVGHVQMLRTKRAGGAEIETLIKSRMSIKRMGQGLEINTDTRHIETPDGQPIRFSSRIEMSATPTLHEGVIEKGKLRLKTTTAGVSKEREIAWDPEWVLSEGARLLMVKKGFAAGTKYSYKSFNTEFGQGDVAEIDIKGEETKTIHGKERRLTRVEAKTQLQKGVVVTSWVDGEGNAVTTETTLAGMKFVVEPTTKEDALKDAPAELPEIFFQTMPRSAVALPRPRDLTSLTFRMERPDGGFAEWKPPAGTQTLVAREGGTITLRVDAGTPAGDAAPGRDLDIFLKPSPAVQCDDPDILKTAREIAGDEKDRAKVARKLAGWVHDHIEKKSMDIGAASAREVFKDRSGDCTEHAVLLAAMLRAAGIPAKVCTGYLYVRSAWGGHAWTSAWLGKWVDFDATLGSGVADAARIKFSETEAEDAGELMEGMQGAGFMHGGMKIDILEFTLDGKPVKVAPPPPPAGNRFEAPLLGVSFDKPDAWSFKESKDLPPFTMAVLAGPEKGVQAVVSYIDLSYDLVGLDTKKVARKMRAPSSGKEGRLSGCDTYETDERLYVRLSPGEVLEVIFEGDDAAKPALDRIKETLKILR